MKTAGDLFHRFLTDRPGTHIDVCRACLPENIKHQFMKRKTAETPKIDTNIPFQHPDLFL